MLEDLIDKVAAQTGVPAETVRPVVGALLSHFSEVLPAPVAHMVAVAMGIHPRDPDQAGADAASAASDDAAPAASDYTAPAASDYTAPARSGEAGGLGGLLGGLEENLAGAGRSGTGGDALSGLLGGLLGRGAAQGDFAGAGSLANAAESLLGGLLARRA
jgi:hypothetical protein